MPGRNILLTGPPGCGKTTFVRELLGALSMPATGFVTEEVRERGRRVGFILRTLDGQEGWLAHVGFRGPHRVGRYGVSLATVEEIGIPALQPTEEGQLIVVDEIGKMECLSAAFRQAVRAAMDGRPAVLATVAERAGGFPKEIRSRGDIRIFRLDLHDRSRLLKLVRGLLEGAVNLGAEALPGK